MKSKEFVDLTGKYGAGEGTRTPTPKAPEPKSGASTNSATPAIFFSLAKPT